MDNWIQAIYNKTGIPLNEDDLALEYNQGQWWLILHGYSVLPVGVTPDPNEAITPATRAAIAWGMRQRLSEIIPKVQRLIEALCPETARDIDITVVCAEGMESAHLDSNEFDSGWPLFLLRLSTGTVDVEVDLNPYVPDDPFDFDDVQRQAAVILQVARSN